MKYYSTHRPIAPGTFPRIAGNAVVEIYNYDYKTMIPAIYAAAWGWIEYEAPLDPAAAAAYELTPECTVVYDGKPVKGLDEFSYRDARPGDLVDAAVVMEALNCVPPISMRMSCAQVGEPYDSRIGLDGKWHNTYTTFRAVSGDFSEGVWEYCGDCFYGETTPASFKEAER